MIDSIYDEIVQKLEDQNLSKNKEYFDMDNVPDSVVDKSFSIAPINFDEGDFETPQNKRSFQGKIINLKALMKIYIARKIPAKDYNSENKNISSKNEDIIKSVLSIGVGSDEKDQILFAGSSSVFAGTVLISEIDFNIDYRINNLI